MSDCKVVIVGAGAAGVAVAKLLDKYAQPNIIMVDSQGIISRDRKDLNASKTKLLEFSNRKNVSGSLEDAVSGADIFVGVSKANLLTSDMVKSMAKDPIVFALANPDPEILPADAKAAGAAVVATGRSDYPNQVNNAIAFPGIFRGALDNHVRKITDEHKLAVAKAMASLIESPSADEVIPSVFDARLVPASANVIR